MAPSKTKTAPHKSNDHKRYLAEDANESANFTIDLNGSDAEGKALQKVNKSNDSDFEGFGSEDEDKDGEEGEEDSDAESVKINIEEKKHEKVILPKDAEEEELERLIFGDSAGFKEGLDNFSLSRTAGMYGDASDEEQDDEADLDNVADDNLFFFDTGPEAAPAGSVAVTKAEETDDEEDVPAWDDSDDERLVVSLASVPQLRKLRETAEDDMVNGKEYARRLRKQYERLYPAPEWAAHATGKANKKRTRTMDDDESGEESGSDMDVDEDDLSTQPLARLLKDADILSRNTARGPVKRRKLQSGTIDIQRLKDVSKAGPVSLAISREVRRLLTPDSPQSHLSRSTLRTHCCFRPDLAQRCPSTTSTRTHRTPTPFSHRYISNARHSQPLHSTHRLPTLVYS
jgi:U3 small nucleolar RNA-associated protein 18